MKEEEANISKYYFNNQQRTIQYVAQDPACTSIRPLKTKTQFLPRPFQLSVNEVFRMGAHDLSLKMQVFGGFTG